MCDCIEKLEKRVMEHVVEKKAYKKPVIKVEMQGKVFSLGESLSLKTVTEFEITLEGQKKKPTISVAHSFCPFCGKDKSKAA